MVWPCYGMRKRAKKHNYTVIIERIREMVRENGLQPGDRLPPERVLAAAFHVSRGSLRQALQALAERHIVESRQGQGTYLLADFDTVLPGDAILEKVSEHDNVLHDIFEFRRIIEPEIAALAAQRANVATLNQLKVLVYDQQRALFNNNEVDQFDTQFHQLLVAMTGNSVIAQVMQAIQAIVDTSRAPWLQSRKRRQMSIEGHLRIIDALEKKESDGARRAMQQHLAAVEQFIFDNQ